MRGGTDNMTNYLDQIQIASPCTIPWESMTGSDTIRHCSSCDLDVYNISTMNKQEAEDFFAKSLPQGRVCARLYRRPDGTILTDDCPRALRAIRNAARSVQSKVAILIALLMPSLSSYAQSTDDGKTVAPKPTKSSRFMPSLLIKPVVPTQTEVRRHTTGAIALPPEPQPDLGQLNPKELQIYMSEVQKQINNSYTPPKSHDSAKVALLFTVNRKGEISNLRLADSTGSSETDQAALQAVKKAAPFKPLPKGLPDDTEIQITLDPNKLNGQEK